MHRRSDSMKSRSYGSCRKPKVACRYAICAGNTTRAGTPDSSPSGPSGAAQDALSGQEQAATSSRLAEPRVDLRLCHRRHGRWAPAQVPDGVRRVHPSGASHQGGPLAGRRRGEARSRALRFAIHGRPTYIRSDNGPEFIAEAVRSWLATERVDTHYIEPVSPWQNAYGESFNDLSRRLPEPLGIFIPPARLVKLSSAGWRSTTLTACMAR